MGSWWLLTNQNNTSTFKKLSRQCHLATSLFDEFRTKKIELLENGTTEGNQTTLQKEKKIQFSGEQIFSETQRFNYFRVSAKEMCSAPLF